MFEDFSDFLSALELSISTDVIVYRSQRCSNEYISVYVLTDRALESYSNNVSRLPTNAKELGALGLLPSFLPTSNYTFRLEDATESKKLKEKAPQSRERIFANLKPSKYSTSSSLKDATKEFEEYIDGFGFVVFKDNTIYL